MDDAKARKLADLLQEVAEGRSLVRAAEYHGVRGYLQEFKDVWETLNDLEMELKDNQRYRVEQSAFALLKRRGLQGTRPNQLDKVKFEPVQGDKEEDSAM